MGGRMIRSLHLLTVLVISGLVAAGSLSAQTVPDARVRYLSAGTVYLDQGSNIGLKAGDQLDIIRNKTTIAKVEVIYLATASASCKIISQQQDIKVGDIARWLESTAGTAQTDTITEVRTRVIPLKPTEEVPPSLRTRVSGVFSLQWYHRTDNTAIGLDFDQWNARLSVRVRNMWTPDLNLNVNTRARFDRRTYAVGTNVPQDEWRNRIYWISLAYEPADAPVNFQAGRIASNKFSGLGYLDGLILQHNISKHLNWGIFGGVQPDMRSVDFSTEMQKYGIYGTYRSGSYSDTYLQTTLALAGSYTKGSVNREYAYFEFRISEKSGWRLNHSMEIDYNRSWRKEYSGTTFSLTSIYLSGSYKFNDWITAGLGYDNRKNYLTYVYYSLAQELFNEAQRQSLRGDMLIRIPADMTISLRAGAREGKGDASISTNYGITLVKSNLLSKSLQASLAFTGFHTLYNQGISPTASIRFQMGAISSSAAYGSYRYTLTSRDEYRVNQYLNFSLSLPVWDRIYVLGQYYYDWGDDMQGHRVLTELGYRL